MGMATHLLTYYAADAEAATTLTDLMEALGMSVERRQAASTNPDYPIAVLGTIEVADNGDDPDGITAEQTITEIRERIASKTVDGDGNQRAVLDEEHSGDITGLEQTQGAADDRPTDT